MDAKNAETARAAVGGLSEFTQEAAPVPPGSDDERTPLGPPVAEACKPTVERTLGEARRADQNDRDQRVDDEDALREALEDRRHGHEDPRDQLGDDDRPDHV